MSVLPIQWQTSGDQTKLQKEHKGMINHQSFSLISKYQTKGPQIREWNCKMYGENSLPKQIESLQKTG